MRQLIALLQNLWAYVLSILPEDVVAILGKLPMPY